MSLDPLTAILNVGESVINRIWPDANKRAEEMRKLEELKRAGDLAQLEAHVKLLTGQMQVNAEEAKHKSVFVAGWRPACGWVGGIAFCYAAVLEPFMRFVATLNGYDGEFPQLDTTLTMQILFGMLGLGVMRSFDKSKGVQTDAIDRAKG